MIVRSVLLSLCLLMAASALSTPLARVARSTLAPQTTSVAGRWQYVQPPDREGEILDLFMSEGRWRGIMNGLERTGDHGLFYYVVEVEQLAVDPDGTMRFEIGERSLFRNRPALSRLGGVGDGGFVRSRMRFSGRIEGGDLVLRCEDDDGSCPAFTLAFKAQDKLLGLLALPDVFGAGPCDKFTPTEIPLYAAPDSGPIVGVIRVDQYWTFHDVGGCDGLTVNVHRSDGQGVRELPVKEHAYEDPGAVVLEQRGRWFKVPPGRWGRMAARLPPRRVSFTRAPARRRPHVLDRPLGWASGQGAGHTKRRGAEPESRSVSASHRVAGTSWPALGARRGVERLALHVERGTASGRTRLAAGPRGFGRANDLVLFARVLRTWSTMSPEAFRRIALAMNGVVEGAHMGHPDFRVHGKIFATLHPDQQWGMVKLTPEQQQHFVQQAPATFAPEKGAWGRQGCTAVRLDAADDDVLGEAMTLAWQNVSRKRVTIRPKARPRTGSV